MSKPILYGPGFSYFLRSVRILFRYKGIDHVYSNAPFGEVLPFFGEEHGKLHPFRKLPVLVDGGLVLPETLAIALYVESQPGPSFIKGNAAQKAQIISLACMISQYVHKAIMANLILEFRFPKGSDGTIRYDFINENLAGAESVLVWLVKQLNNRRFIFGEQFTLADAYLIPMIDYLHQLPEPYNVGLENDSLSNYLNYHRAQPYSVGVLGAAT